MTQSQGRVDILGAGPGSPEFLTLAGQRILAQAEVLIYDALINPRLLTLPQRNCQLIEMGKRGGQLSVSQSDINQRLVQACQQGKRVVRLKAGDPFIFGRTRSEVEALKSAKCEVMVWPGLSSVFAAPLLAGIPLTDKDLSQSVALISGHNIQTLNWEAIAQLDTLVILMGTQTLAEIGDRLLQAGKAPSTPIAIIRWCSWPQQESWFGSLETIDALAKQALSPAVIIVGQVVTLHQRMELQPCMHKTPQPLEGKTIVVTRAAGQASQFRDRLEALGAQVIEMPALEIVEPSSWQALDEAIADLKRFDWLILTSANAVEFFFQRLQTHHQDARALAGIKIAVVGRKTAASLGQFGLTPDYTPPNFVADSLVDHFPADSLQGLNILFPRVESGGREVLVKSFQSQGAQVAEVSAYQSRCPDQIPSTVLDAFKNRSVDAITFASSKTVLHVEQILHQYLDELNLGQTEMAHSVSELLDGVCIASIGPQTSHTCQQKFGRVSLEPAEYTLEALAVELADYFSPERNATNNS